MSESEKQHLSETLEKGLRILSLFNERRQNMTLTEISNTLEINKTSIYRYLNTYCKLGYLRKDPQTKLFKLGPRTAALAQGFLLSSDLVNIIKPTVNKVHIQRKLHIDVGLLHGESLYLIYRMETKDTMSLHNFTVEKQLHFLAMGKAALAFLPKEEQQNRVLKLDFRKKTPKSIDNQSELMAELKQIHKRGYATSNEEYFPGLIAIAAPLINAHTSQVQGAISFDSLTSRYTLKEFEKKYANELVALSQEISTLLPSS